MNYLSKESIDNMMNGQPITGVAILKNAEIATTKRGGEFIKGTLECKGEVPLKMWDNSPGFVTLKNNSKELLGKVVAIEGKADEYGGTISILAENLYPCNEEVDVSRLMISKYNIEAIFNRYMDTLKELLSPDAYQIFETIIKKEEQDFKTTVAAIYHHDNCLGGLVAHSYKVVQILHALMNLYKNIGHRINPDLLFLGAAIHDIGKILEYKNGAMSDIGKSVSHLTLGSVMIYKHNEIIISTMGLDFYFKLLSIISQHHGDYGDAPRTIEAYLVHKADMMDAKLTELDDKLEGTAPDAQIKIEDFKLG